LTFVAANVPDATSTFQSMINQFGTAGTVAIAIIGGAVALGVVVILAMYGWRLAKKWLSASK
jgi:Ca2+/Na+ antiporter